MQIATLSFFASLLAARVTAHPAGWNNVYCQSHTLDVVTLKINTDDVLTTDICRHMKKHGHKVKITECQSSSYLPWRHISSKDYFKTHTSFADSRNEELHLGLTTRIMLAQEAAATCWWEEKSQVVTAHPDMMQMGPYVPKEMRIMRYKDVLLRNGFEKKREELVGVMMMMD